VTQNNLNNVNICKTYATATRAGFRVSPGNPFVGIGTTLLVVTFALCSFGTMPRSCSRIAAVLVLVACTLQACAGDVILKPVGTAGRCAAVLVLVQEDGVPAEAYVPLLSTVQDAYLSPLWYAVLWLRRHRASRDWLMVVGFVPASQGRNPRIQQQSTNTINSGERH